eukprot:m.12529 g.12529  ORF g.12529 m.12529 type:complete len:183 (-) comp9968_c0_seq1:20-568(-)
MAAMDVANVPTATFLEDVDSFMASKTIEDVDTIIGEYQDHCQKYELLESQVQRKRKIYMQRLPEMKKTVAAIKRLQKQRDAGTEVKTTFPLSDGVFARATVPPQSTVSLWLGANVMLEYDIDEAATLLQAQAEGLEKSIERADEQLGFLKDQITTVQVNIARVYNWRVVRRRLADGIDPPKA